MDEDGVFHDHSMLEVARNLFPEIPQEIIESSYQNHDSNPNFPETANACVHFAHYKFYRSGGDDFKVTVPLDPNQDTVMPGDLTEADLRILRPIFANAFLQNQGISTTERHVRLIERLVPITEDNVEIHTPASGHYQNEIVVNQNAKRICQGESRQRKRLTKTLERIHKELTKAWNVVDNRFPLHSESKKPCNFQLPRGYPTTFALSLIQTPPCRNVSSIKRKKIRISSVAKSPFIQKWKFLITKEEINLLITTFISTFDFKAFFYEQPSLIDTCKQFLQLTIMSRFIYYTGRYLHSILIYNADCIQYYIRARSIWLICYLKCTEVEDTASFLSVILLVLKSCICTMFFHHHPPESFSSDTLANEWIVQFIDHMFDPCHVFFKFDHQQEFVVPDLREIHLRKGKKLYEDIAYLIDSDLLHGKTLELANTMLSSNQLQQLISIISVESWGDHKEDEIVTVVQKGPSSRYTQQMIERDLKELGKTVPRKPPDWIKRRPAIRAPQIKA